MRTIAQDAEAHPSGLGSLSADNADSEQLIQILAYDQHCQLTDLEFVFGQFRTYQVPVSEVEKRTGLDFGKLRRADPLKDRESFAIREIDKLEEIVL